MIIAASFALGVTVLLSILLRPFLSRFGLLDVPNERSSHSKPVLRGGGLAIAVASSAALLVGGVVDGAHAIVLLAVPAGFAALGFADDHRSRSVELRLSTQVVLSAIAAALLATDYDLRTSLVVLASVVTVIWIITYVNLFNFMDGINGITAVTAAIVGVTHMVVGSQMDNDLVAVGGAALVGGSLGFLPFNFPVARVFAGDVGSYYLGSYIAILSVIALVAGASPVTVAAPLLLYLFDTTLTILRRARKGKRIWESHREHSYQHLANNRLTHVRTTLIVAAITSGCAAIGLLAHDRSTAVAAVCGVAVVAMAAVFVLLPLVYVDRRKVPRTAT